MCLACLALLPCGCGKSPPSAASALHDIDALTRDGVLRVWRSAVDDLFPACVIHYDLAVAPDDAFRHLSGKLRLPSFQTMLDVMIDEIIPDSSDVEEISLCGQALKCFCAALRTSLKEATDAASCSAGASHADAASTAEPTRAHGQPLAPPTLAPCQPPAPSTLAATGFSSGREDSKRVADGQTVSCATC